MDDFLCYTALEYYRYRYAKVILVFWICFLLICKWYEKVMNNLLLFAMHLFEHTIESFGERDEGCENVTLQQYFALIKLAMFFVAVFFNIKEKNIEC